MLPSDLKRTTFQEGSTTRADEKIRGAHKDPLSTSLLGENHNLSKENTFSPHSLQWVFPQWSSVLPRNEPEARGPPN